MALPEVKVIRNLFCAAPSGIVNINTGLRAVPVEIGITVQKRIAVFSDFATCGYSRLRDISAGTHVENIRRAVVIVVEVQAIGSTVCIEVGREAGRVQWIRSAGAFVFILLAIAII